jgi:hypothetical protein
MVYRNTNISCLYLVDNTYTWLADRLSRVTFGPIYNAFPAVDTFFALRYFFLLKSLKCTRVPGGTEQNRAMV